MYKLIENDEKLKVEEAEMPTNIIWESRRLNKFDDFWTRLLTYIGIAVLMLSFFGLIVWGKYKSQQLVTPFLPIRCNKMMSEMSPISIYEESVK